MTMTHDDNTVARAPGKRGAAPRRHVLAMAGAALAVPAAQPAPLAAPDALDRAMRSAEAALGARLGAFVRDTGSGRRWRHRFGTNNVVGVLYPPHRASILVGIFITETGSTASESNAAMARLARALDDATADRVGGSPS